MSLSRDQKTALDQVLAWHKRPDRPVFRLFGYAGTGKTTLARSIAEAIDGTVQFAAFTGKAASVLRSKGCDNARTIHSLIYRPRGEETEDETGEVSPTFSLNRQSAVAKADLIIIDECSMVDEELGRDLLSFGTPVLVLGDPGQLPPISGGGFFTEAEPDAMLTEIHRQAAGNPIIQLAHAVREGGEIDYGDYGAARVIRRSDIAAEDVLEADQVLVGTNRTRRRYNARLRELKGFTGLLPQAGDKLVCLRNKAEKGLLNGSLWKVTSVGTKRGQGLQLLVRGEDEVGIAPSVKIKVAAQAFESEAEVPYQIKRRFDDFDFGYALTVHKAQGSQWDRVVLFDESFAFRDTRERWLYTAITRAAEEIVIVR